MVAQSALLGGNVRVGFEDNFYFSRNTPAKSNAQLVEKTVTILKSLDKEPASPQEAREILGLIQPAL
jgi:3-keto-5-aminohexanoate cleavage enzyme